MSSTYEFLTLPKEKLNRVTTFNCPYHKRTEIRYDRSDVKNVAECGCFLSYRESFSGDTVVMVAKNTPVFTEA